MTYSLFVPHWGEVGVRMEWWTTSSTVVGWMGERFGGGTTNAVSEHICQMIRNDFNAQRSKLHYVGGPAGGFGWWWWVMWLLLSLSQYSSQCFSIIWMCHAFAIPLPRTAAAVVTESADGVFPIFDLETHTHTSLYSTWRGPLLLLFRWWWMWDMRMWWLHFGTAIGSKATRWGWWKRRAEVLGFCRA